MIKIITSFVTEIFIGIIAGVFWVHGLHGFYEGSFIDLITSIFAFSILVLIFNIVPPSRPVIRGVFNDYSWIYLAHFGISSFLTGLSPLIQALNFFQGINLPLTLNPYILHMCFAWPFLIKEYYFKSKQYYMTRNVKDDDTEDQTFAIFDDGVCSICLSPHVNASRPQCGHTFCCSCLWSWLKVKTTCPICKGPVTVVTSEQKPKDENGNDFQFDILLLTFDYYEEQEMNEIFVNSVIIYGLYVCTALLLAVSCVFLEWLISAAIN